MFLSICIFRNRRFAPGGYENNWFDLIVRLQKSMPIQAARLNPLGVHANSKANLQRIITDQISAKNVAEYMVAHPEKNTFSSPSPSRCEPNHPRE
jgi:hypothetical protein